MKKAMDQSKLITLLNIVSLVALLVVAALLFIRSGVSGRLNAEIGRASCRERV